MEASTRYYVLVRSKNLSFRGSPCTKRRKVFKYVGRVKTKKKKTGPGGANSKLLYGAQNPVLSMLARLHVSVYRVMTRDLDHGPHVLCPR